MQQALMWSHPFSVNAKVLIEAKVISTINNFRQDGLYKPEAGGILLGFRRGEHLHIVEATIPQSNDRQSLFHFFRRDRRHQAVATARWSESGEVVDYVGEWHTHPEPHPTPSSLDLAEWKKIIRVRKSTMVFLIAGMQGIWLGVGLRDSVCPADALQS